MLKNKRLFSNKYKLLLYVTLLSTLFSCDDSKSNELYTIEECKNLKKGDTIYTKEFYTIKKQIVEKNVVEKELLELRDVEYSWYKNIVRYDDARFK